MSAATGDDAPKFAPLPASERAQPLGTFRSAFRRDLFAGRVALVTGGGTGLGLRIAREFVHCGGTVMLASRKRAVLDAAAARIEADLADDDDATTTATAAGAAAAKRRVFVCELNIRDPKSCAACVAHTLAVCGRLDCLVNNAGGQFPSPADAISAKGWHAVVDTNLSGTFWMCGEAYRQAFQPQSGGVIVNVIANMIKGMPIMAHTGAARAGVDNLTKSLAVEWARSGVRVNALAPGVVVSDGLDRYPPHFKRQMFARVHTLNYAWRPGTAAEVAAAALFLLSDAASFVTGETLKVDGGEALVCSVWPPVAHGNLPAFTDAFPKAVPAAVTAAAAAGGATGAPATAAAAPATRQPKPHLPSKL